MTFQNCNRMKLLFFGGLQMPLFKSLWLHVYSKWSPSRPMNFKFTLQAGCQPCCYGDTRSLMPDGYWPSPNGRKNETVCYSQEEMDCNARCRRKKQQLVSISLVSFFDLYKSFSSLSLAKWFHVTDSQAKSFYVTTWVGFTNLEYHVL